VLSRDTSSAYSIALLVTTEPPPVNADERVKRKAEREECARKAAASSARACSSMCFQTTHVGRLLDQYHPITTDKSTQPCCSHRLPQAMNDLLHTKKGRKSADRLPRLAAMQQQLAATMEAIGLPAVDAPAMLAALREVRASGRASVAVPRESWGAVGRQPRAMTMTSYVLNLLLLKMSKTNQVCGAQPGDVEGRKGTALLWVDRRECNCMGCRDDKNRSG
jgi:hypothetical protein